MTTASDSNNAESERQAVWASTETLPTVSPLDGITMQPMFGEKVMLNFVRLEPNAVLPEHAHDNEQAGTILEGRLTLQIGAETRTLGPGDAFIVPGNMPHQASVGDTGCLVLDVFAPPREDLRPQQK